MGISLARQIVPEESSNIVRCEWQALSAQILDQWKDIEPSDLEATHHDRHRIALLIEEKYGVNSALIENYLCNLERTLPLFQ